MSPEDENELAKALTQIWARRPEWMEQMREFGRVETRRHLREAGLSDVRFPDGEVYAFELPEPIVQAANRYAEKLGRALYYLHTQRVVPPAGCVVATALTNAQYMAQSFPRDGFSALTMKPAVARNGRDLADQFFYRYALRDEGGLAMFLVQFRESLAFVIAVHEDRETMDRLRVDARARLGLPDAPTEGA